MNVFLALRSPAPMLKPPPPSVFEPNGLAAAGGAPAAKGFAPKAGVMTLALPKGLAMPADAAGGAPNAGLALALPNGLAIALPPKLEVKRFAAGALFIAGAGKVLAGAEPNSDAPAAEAGDLLVSNGLIGSGVLGCSSGLGALPNTLVVASGLMFTLNPAPNGFAPTGLVISLPPPNTNAPLLGAGVLTLAPNTNPPLAAPLVAGTPAAPNFNAGVLSDLLSLATTVDVPNAGAAAPPKLKPVDVGLGASLAGFVPSTLAVAAPKLNALGASSLGLAPNVNGVAAAGVAEIPPKLNAGAAADKLVFGTVTSSAFSAGLPPKVKGVAAGAGAGVEVKPPKLKAPLAGFAVTVVAAVDPPKLNAGCGSGTLTGTFSGDLGGGLKANVGALVGASAVFDPPAKKDSKPESPAGFAASACFAASAGFAGALTPKVKAGAAPTVVAGADAVCANEKPAPLLAPAGGIPNENAGAGTALPAVETGAKGEGFSGFAAAAPSSSSIAA